MLSVKACLLATNTCLTYAFVTQQPFDISYFHLKFGHMHLCGMNYKCFSPHCCKCNSFGCTTTIRCGNTCHGPHSDSLYSGSEHSQLNSPRLVKRETGIPNPRGVLIGLNQLWRVNDSHTTDNLGLRTVVSIIIEFSFTRQYLLQ